MAEQTKKEKLSAACSCGSGKKYGECCGRNEPCACGSGKKAGECCFKKK
ncbi:MAG: SEC-C domain-containing protein [Deltaproteobacteria bacterium]|nr:SEC-C domain-containing protein [Deltaproteobacteria bacterium]